MTSTTSQHRFAAPEAALLPGGRARYLLAALAVVAPLAQLVWSLTLPYAVTDDLPTSYAAVADRSGLMDVNLATQMIFGLTAVLSALIVGASVRRGARVIGTIATVVAVIGGSIGWASPSGHVVLAAARTGIPVDDGLDLAARIDEQIGGMLTFVAFPLIPLGYLLFGVAAIVAARRGRFPWWGAIVLAAAIPVILVGGSFAGIFLAIGWALVTLGVGVASFSWAHAGGVRAG